MYTNTRRWIYPGVNSELDVYPGQVYQELASFPMLENFKLLLCKQLTDSGLMETLSIIAGDTKQIED